MCCSPSIVCHSHNSKRTGRRTFADTIPRIQGDHSIKSIFGKFFLHHGIRPWQQKISWQGSEVQEFFYPYDLLAIPPSSMAPSEVTDYGEKSCFCCWFWCSFNSICWGVQLLPRDGLFQQLYLLIQIQFLCLLHDLCGNRLLTCL